MTVKSLIASLVNLPENKQVLIRDADTNWLLSNLEIRETDEFVEISSNYTAVFDKQ